MPSPRSASVTGPRRFGLVEMGGVDQAPARVDWRMAEQPRDGSLPAPRHARFDLLDLLGGVDVDRAVGQHRQQRGELVGRHRTQAVRRDAEARVGQRGYGLARPLDAGAAPPKSPCA